MFYDSPRPCRPSALRLVLTWSVVMTLLLAAEACNRAGSILSRFGAWLCRVGKLARQ